MLRVALSLLFLAACGGGGGGEGSLDGGGDPSEQADAGDGDGNEPTGCGPASCDGCCDGDTCRPGDGDDECGAGGAACQACGRWGECGAAAICELAAATRWDVVVESATVSAVNSGGTGWDGDGDLPDVYVRATATSGDAIRSERTDAHEDLTPTWNQTVLADLPAGALEGMWIEPFDSDGNADDSFGRCLAAVRLEDAEAGAFDLTCPRGETIEPRAGWTVRLRLEPRSTGRPDAPALDRRAAPPLESEPGSCTITLSRMGEWRQVVSYDAWGRPLREESHLDSGEVLVDDWVCPGEFHCERPGDGFSLRLMEPGPFGRRVRVASHDVLLYDSIGRLVARRAHFDGGGVRDQTLFRYAAKEKVARHQSLDDSPTDDELDTTEFDEHGSPLFISDARVTRQVTLDRDGLPVRIEVAKSTAPEVPVGSADDYAYQGAGCAEVLAAEITNGLVSR